MTKKKTYVAPQAKVHQIQVESVILTGSDPVGQPNETYEEGTTTGWFNS